MPPPAPPHTARCALARRWLRQHRVLQQLNIQAHANAQRNADPFVMEALLTFNKLPVLLHELLVSEAWTWRVAPLVADRVAGRNSTRAYFAVRRRVSRAPRNALAAPAAPRRRTRRPSL